MIIIQIKHFLDILKLMSIFYSFQRLKECNICGKRVMALQAHLKTHEKRPQKCDSPMDVSSVMPSPATKSKRQAAQK